MRGGTTFCRLLVALAALAAVAVVVAASSSYQGSPVVFLAFNATFLAMVALAGPAPRLYVYTFLAILLFLGFWLKAVTHALWGIGIIESTGDFQGSPDEWDSALITAAWAAVGVGSARAIHLFAARRRTAATPGSGIPPAPRWFPRARTPLWILSLVTIVAVNILNFKYAFYQVGVNPVWVLPWKLNVPVAWLVNTGFALWLSSLIWWEFRSDRSSLAATISAAMLEAFCSSVSAFSRALFFLHAAPYGLVLYERWRDLGATLARWKAFLLVTAFAVILCMSVLTVFLLRAVSYQKENYEVYSADIAKQEPGRLISERESLTRYLGEVLERQLPNLLVYRWVGMESILTVGSIPDRGWQRLRSAVVDDPKRGADTLFQRDARPRYLSTDPQRFTFLTNAGVVAVLAYSGSALAVFAGMALITGVLIATEEFAARVTGNPFLLGVAGLGLANVVSQMTFPYLSLIFLLQLWAAIAFLAVLERLRSAAHAGDHS